MQSLEQTLTRSIWIRASDGSILPLPNSDREAQVARERRQLQTLVQRVSKTALVDRLLNSKWLREHDDRIREETLRDVIAGHERGDYTIIVT
jgi:hypothetical protein